MWMYMAGLPSEAVRYSYTLTVQHPNDKIASCSFTGRVVPLGVAKKNVLKELEGLVLSDKTAKALICDGKLRAIVEIHDLSFG
jgi:hypothetical protein